MSAAAAFSDWFPGITAFVGVLVGGLITYLVEKGRREHEVAQARESQRVLDQKERAAEDKAARAVARMWQDEFLRALQALTEAERAGNRWVPAPGHRFFGEMTREDRLLLAAYLSEDAWYRVAHAHANAALVVGGVTEHADELIDPTVFNMDEGKRALEEGAVALQGLTSD